MESIHKHQLEEFWRNITIKTSVEFKHNRLEAIVWDEVSSSAKR